MKKLGLKAVVRQAKHNSEDYRHKSTGYIYDNLLNQEFTAQQPCEKWCTDFTEIPTAFNTLYLVTIMDLFNNEILGYELSETNSVDDLEVAYNKALQHKKTEQETHYLHSDQGSPFRSYKYKNLLESHGITPSMSRKGKCWDNATMEGFFSHLKTEGYILFPFQTDLEAHESIRNYIEFYNQRRGQSKLKGLAPKEYKNQIAA